MITRPVAAALLAVFLAGAPAMSEPLRVDKEKKTVTFEGRIAPYDKYPQLKGAIEYGLVVTKAGKAYESLIECDVAPAELLEALKAIGAKTGSPATRDDDDRVMPPRGDWVAVLVEWEEGGARKKVRLEEMVLDARTRKTLAVDAFLFPGSVVTENPATSKEELLANQTKNLLALHQTDRSVLLQNPVSDPPGGSSPYLVNKEKTPPQETKLSVTLSIADPAVTGMRRVRTLVKGKVQGVGFRDFTSQTATSLKLTGWVKNLADGDVEVVAEGPAEALQILAEKLMTGPPTSKVSHLFILEAKAGTGEFKTFEVKS